MDGEAYGKAGYEMLKGTLMDVRNHPVNNVPNASEHYWASPVNSSGKSDMQEKLPAKGSDRYGGADLPSSDRGSNEREFYDTRDN